ncbi:metal-dependent amidase/aminoacylase/carboxypeptidase [Amycolatopsis mediterranei S699]|uniref:Metal-dependent amidase/aminoacylase/carboxypeptidase n=2 Tax=Amycolatopsis mediterranei TaxID=33910 RepID=A0A0H3DBW1_AMYMU|nr:M20 family metallopeptidase [Amycolatopsis mediterranei]ADJ47104.1 metal-dependent amidase/aminoacylase/carboxypeptidase [Amycolatopsis mediterranei U32]AEK43922.1 metal-dependent amidase/aminoacylase/carboxypeptidase [Amycolatopsis mediterranei S699]AFO78815.1 metal-dependent amidase/aminoacylase/carboxypeptidase [Amycolatopsis mediterranei S699]AGT85943.1 metal-dependent amidase/aminoacylase/carboxypeptidase [Amycolatopsis mediterranei RB]KDO04552.1 amidohydrolase [Amycolatopsis mediterra
MSVHEDATAIHDDMIRLRRRLHAEPEIGLDLPRTQDSVLTALDGLPLEVSLGERLSSVTAVLRANRPGPVVLLRADMDALPVQERTGLDYASRVEGVMHACGHDLHTAMLVGAAHVLAARRDALPGDVIFMFQPGEEGWDGSAAMIAEGVLDAAGQRPDAAYALHVFASAVPQGVFTARPGTTMAASDGLEVTVVGSGGHGARPHRAHDPIPVVCEIVTALQTLVTRQSDIFDPVVLTVGSLHAGTRRNVIPDTARFEATLRTFSAPAKARIKDAAIILAESIARAHGLRAEVTYVDGYPMTVNDPQETAFVAGTVGEVLGEHRFHPLAAPLPGGEDFSRVLQRIPGAFVLLGAGVGTADNHSPLAEFDDSVLPDGAAVLAELALRRGRGVPA